ncbi:hypothetical protein L1D34_10125 [Vibrio mediterranei]|nr:hypothetical protein [Vibrio mediterranei]MCG9625200.1 hypothetical protein [Vibrio mediterranei]
MTVTTIKIKVVYGTPMKSARRNAAAPITGGNNCPLVDDADSTAPEKSFQ